MKILAIETSCDETAAAVIENGRHIRSNVVATQIDLHRRFGGVFPEVASRQHVLSIHPVIEQALDEAGIGRVSELDALAVTVGPGLAGSLLVGVNAAKGLSFASGLPLLPINHLEGHIYSNWLEVNDDSVNGEGMNSDGMNSDGLNGDSAPDNRFPLLILIVSGGHTELVLMEGHGHYQRLGQTLDDAAGEAFDKVARLLNLGFPGGPAIQAAASRGDARRFQLPRPLLYNRNHRFNFSFSGLKTATLNLVRDLERKGERVDDPTLVADIAAAFQTAAVDVLVAKTADAATTYNVQQVCICGGVSANEALRSLATARFDELQLLLHVPPLFLCTDNAAMIGAAAYYRSQYTPGASDGLAVDVRANLSLSG